eukprot:scaffold45995_cov74-Cyclotella_meneghiniana.AAC.1
MVNPKSRSTFTYQSESQPDCSVKLPRGAIFCIVPLLLSITNIYSVSAWCNMHPTHPSRRIQRVPSQHPRIQTTRLCGGAGIATTYTWKEEQFEIELSLPVPMNTTAKDVKFKCTSNSVDLRLVGTEEECILLHGDRYTRGKICVDGTFWSITDSDRIEQDGSSVKQREIHVIIEKHFVPTSTSGGMQTYDQLTDFDWGGIYPNDEEEVSFREYDQAEELNVREYAAKLGVDIDNIDMSKVDKTMFGAGLHDASNVYGASSDLESIPSDVDKPRGSTLNITQATLDQLVKFGLAKEVVRQGDGTEYEMDAFSSDLERKHFSMLGKDVSVEELRDAGVVGTPNKAQSNVKHNIDEPVVESPELKDKADNDDDDGDNPDISAKDPIDKLTVKKLKDILRREGLRVSGNKLDLQDRLRRHVQSLMEK